MSKTQNPALTFHPATRNLPVMKYGGASLASAQDLFYLQEIVNSEDVHFLIVSAFSGVTQKLSMIKTLVESQKHREAENIFDECLSYHMDICTQLEISCDSITSFDALSLEFRDNLLQPTPEKQRRIVSYGEIWSCEIIRVFLNKNNQDKQQIFHAIDSEKYFFVNPDGSVNQSLTFEKLVNSIHLNRGKRIIMAGFIASDGTNLGLNGSDTTAALVAAALEKDGISPALTFFKKEKFQGEIQYNTSIEYGTFLQGQENQRQPYIHPDAVSILQNMGIVFRVLAKEDPTFSLIVSQSQTRVLIPSMSI